MGNKFILTLRQAIDEGNEVIASRSGVDIMLQTNSSGRLIFPDDIFQEARKMLEDNEALLKDSEIND